MRHTPLAVRLGLWRVTRNGAVRRLYERLENSGFFVSQLDLFERETTKDVSGAETDKGAPDDVALDVRTLKDENEVPDALEGAPLAPTDRLVVATDDERIVGYCCLSDRPVYVPELHRRLRPPGAYLWKLYVKPDMRGLGIGKALIGRSVRCAPTEFGSENITALVAPDNLPSRKAFHRLEFVPTERYTSIGFFGRERHRERSLDE